MMAGTVPSWVRLLVSVVLRLVLAVVVVVIAMGVALAIPRMARPDLYGGQTGLGGIVDAMGRALFHFDFGFATGWAGAPPVRDMWARGYAADIWMLSGSVAIGIGVGFGLGLWCVRRAGTRHARVVEQAATLFYLTPVYAVGWLLLLAFQGSFGRFPIPYFFDAAPVWASPFQSPWDWFRTLLVPWLVAAAPLAAMCMRLVIALLREELESDHVRTAIAKGVPQRKVISHHAGPHAHAATLSLVSVSAPIVVTNLILVERIFAVPGFFFHTWRATGHSDSFRRGPVIDYDMLAGIAIWASVFVVLLSVAMDLALMWVDPRIRAGAATT